jgi:hypothetical protein
VRWEQAGPIINGETYMTAITRQCRLLAASTLLAAIPLGAAWGQTVDAAVERLKALVEEQGAAIKWQSVDVDGSDAVLVGVEIGTSESMVPIGDVALNGISEDDKGYRIESVTLDRYEMSDDTGNVLVDGVSLAGVVLPSESEIGNYGGFLFYETAEVDSVVVTVGDVDVFTLTNLSAEVNEPDGGTPMEFTGAAENFTVDLSIVEDPAQKAVIEALGYEQVEGSLDMAGSWNPTDGRIALTQYDLSVANAGTLGLSFDLGGYTPDFIASLRELQEQMSDNPDADDSAQGMAMLGLMQQLTFHGAEISFADDSLTGKVLDYIAQRQGMDASDVANQAKAILPFAMAQLNNPELTQMVTQAVGAFLDNPQNLTIAAEPAEPVPFALIMAGAMSAPQELTKTLGVTVTANE